MPLEEKKYDIEANNDWAKNVKGEHLFIDSAKSGRKGYFCIGCDKQMEAVKKRNINHRSYFRHVPVDISKDEKPCTFSNRKYRENLATDILQRLKSIKVPNVYKYPPKGEDGAPMLLEKSKFVTAKKVKSQLTFYEDSNGEVKYGKNPDVEDRYLLIRPDVIFFDANDKPILLIELVITHKVNEEKKIKLRRLGIDTISIIVPKSSEQEIEDNFKTTKRVKWEYNGIEASTEYIPVPSGTSEGILEFDEDQRRIFEESLTCRKARLNNTLRTIKKCLQSEPYRRAEHDFESEISRIERATKAEKEGLEEMEARFNKEVYTQFKSQFDDLERNGEVIEERRANLEQESKDLETRYFNKRREFDQEEADISRSIREHSNLGESSEGVRTRFRVRKAQIGTESESIKNTITRIRGEIKGLPEAFKQLESESAERFEKDRGKLEEQERSIESEIDNFGEYAKEEERNLELEFEELGKQSIERINKRDSKGDSELSKRIESILNVGRISTNYNERLKTYERYKSYLGLARSRAWEK
ncbi:hypothetical protein [Yeosuana marina]|uniref:hypothetical protein n=1 Tax=Yeosuana marina TaxID=1565536 RepID=UPI0030EC26A5